ncbi:hypothetical protein [Micromonospora eburnea]|uniref:Uncharacterized protein n=1 Tax=Micromonospora eburnea TaxID=227316 RepID=A0A1C6UWI3_9ACTN|nr:hypothetical protein [Micromonospora eburnea]SCL58432.1 hypothetical protein GA0070604_3831 [Micromonospora eburnea]
MQSAVSESSTLTPDLTGGIVPDEAGSSVLVTDGTPDVQQWLDKVVDAARLGTPGDWPHPHTEIPRAVITLDRLAKEIAVCFAFAGVPWSLAEDGLPPLPGAQPGSTSELAARDPGHTDPTKGSAYHNLMHSLLGDFH